MYGGVHLQVHDILDRDLKSFDMNKDPLAKVYLPSIEVARQVTARAVMTN